MTTPPPESDRFSTAIGRKVVSRASAEELGQLSGLLVDVGRRHVTELVVGKGRRGRSVGWAHVTGFGPDAVMLDDAASLDEEASGDPGVDLLGKRALSEAGIEAGKVDDVIFDPASGEILGVVVGTREHAGSDLLGAGSYAAVLAAGEAPAREG